MPSRRAALVFALGLLVASLAAVVAHLMGARYIDFNLYYYAGLLERASTYTDTPQLLKIVADAGLQSPNAAAYGAPSLIALFFQPLSFLPFSVAFIAFQLGGAALTTFAILKAADKGRWPVWLLVTIFTPAALLGLLLGNFSTYTAALIILAFASLKNGKDGQVGIFLGLATVFKLYPGFLFIALIVTKRWRALGYSVAVTVALLSLTVPTLSWDSTVAAVRATANVGSGVPKTDVNISVPAYFLLITGAQGIANALSPLLLAGSCIVLWAKRRQPHHYVFALACVLMLLSQSLAWRQYASLYIVAMLALYSVTPAAALRRAGWVFYALSTGFAAFVVVFAFDLPPSIVALSYTGGGVGLAAALIMATRHSASEALSEAS